MKQFGFWACAILLGAGATAWAQGERRSVIDVESYQINAAIVPDQQSARVIADVTFVPQDAGNTLQVWFELHNALRLSQVTDSQGRKLQTSRTVEDSSVKVTLAEGAAKGAPQKLRFEYEGRLTGIDESPVYGLSFASISPTATYLMYPSRWFPISGYTTDRYTMNLSVKVPPPYKVLSSGLERSTDQEFVFQTAQPGFPGSLAVVQGTPQKAQAQGFNSTIWFRGERQAFAPAWGESVGKVMTFLASLYGLAPNSNMTLVETEKGAPNGYSAPGMLFLSPSAITKTPSDNLLANQLTRQWFGLLVSPSSRNHLWISNGMARYAEVLYAEQLNGPNSVEPAIQELYVDALTVTDAPVRQSARYEDYSPEFFAVTGGKGAAVWNMLRWIVGNDRFPAILKVITEQWANKSVNTEDVRKVSEGIYGQSLQGFFIQWLESTGAPEFKLDYTVYRTQKGFRVLGKIMQDLDTFRMPVEIRIETEGNPEDKRIDVSGPSTEFSVDTFGKPKKITVDPAGRMLRLSPSMRVAVAIRKGEQFVEVGDYQEALKEYQKALDVNRISSLAHYRVGEVFFLQGNYQSAANEFREALNGDLDPEWTKVWSHINLGKIYDITQQRDRARNEYQQALRTKDNTQGAQEEAAKYMQTPYQRETRD